MMIVLWKMTMILMFSLMAIIMFLLKKSPAKLIFSIIIFTSMLSLQISNNLKNAWIGFSLFFLIVSGLMILFSMITSIIPKSNFNSHKNNFMVMMLLPIFFISVNESTMPLNPNTTLNFKMQMFWIIIITLNMMLLLISKLISSYEKTFRSKSQ